ncbi:MAG: type II toxin-antitoxin system VapC family toxin [Chloroflexi bacterium]|nr:type II toxin-antitoxin system VapC family toxin [Chloroflexota bacterium]
MTLLLDTHVLHWWSSASARLSATAVEAIEGADELAVAAITWFEIAWLAKRQRIEVPMATTSWLTELALAVRTAPLTPAIAATAAALDAAFPSDPADRLIYATAVEHGWRLVTKDERLRRYPQQQAVTLW